MADRSWDRVLGGAVDAPPGVKSFISRVHASRPVEILPHVRTDEPIVGDLLTALFEEVQRRFPPSELLSSGYVYPGMPPGIDRILTAQGELPDPSGTPYVDARPVAREVALGRVDPKKTWQNPEFRADTVRFSKSGTLLPEDRAVLRDVVSLMFGLSGPTSIPVARLATTGIPHMTKNVDVKADIGRAWLTDHVRRCKLVEADALPLLYREGVAFCYFNGYRTQADRTTVRDGRVVTAKERVVTDWTGKTVPMLKDLPKDHPNYGRLVRVRTRSFAAFGFSASFPLRAVARSWERYLYQTYPYAMKHRGAEDIQAKLEGVAATRLFDVTQHDQSMLEEIILEIESVVGQHLPEHTYKMFRWMLHAPILVHNDAIGGKGAALSGDFTDVNGFTSWFMNPSGNPFTSIIAKIAGVFYAILALIRVGLVGRSRVEYEQLLRGQHPRAVLVNLGDNLVLGVRDAGDAHLLENLAEALYCAGLDAADSFGGSVAVDNNGSSVWYPNLPSFWLRWFCHDRDVSSPYRRFWMQGWFDRQDDYRSHPHFAEALAMTNEVVKLTFGVSMDDIARQAGAELRPVETAQDALVRRFRENRDAIYYKMDVEDLPPNVVSEEFLNFPEQLVAPMFNHLVGRAAA